MLKETLLSMAVIALLSGCGGTTGSTSSSTVKNDKSIAVRSVVFKANQTCANGGVEIFTGIDTNGNGVLDLNEQTSSETICNGTNGTNGVDGKSAYQIWLDANNTGTEADFLNSLKGSNGIDGIDGTDGTSALVATNSLPAGDAHCSNGGVEILIGMDNNRDNILQSSEVTSTRYVCNGTNGMNAQTAPIIHTLYTSPTVAFPNQMINLGAVVSDPDGGTMHYSWKDANGTELSQDVTLTTHAPSAEGSYLYSFSAIDDMNNSITGYIDVQVMVSDSGQPTQNQSVVVGDTNVSIAIDQNISLAPVTGDIDGTLLVGGPDQNVIGAIFMKPDFDSRGNAQTILDDTINTLSTSLQNGNSAQFTNISTRNLPSSTAIPSGVMAYYDVHLNGAEKPVSLLNKIVALIGSNVRGGVVTTSLSDTSSFASDKRFRVGFTVQYIDATHVLTRVAVVERYDYNNYSGVMQDILNPFSVQTTGQVLEHRQESFTAHDTSVTNKVDFLFVVDNSASMNSHQNNVRQAAQDFATSLANSNLDYHIGIITTDNSNLVGGGFIDNNITEFEQRVMVGTNGSPTETGIYESEQALMSTAYGDDHNGSVTLSGYPRQGAHLNVIILTDERSQYTSRSNHTFDVNHNLFVDRGYTVYGIINQRSAGQYSELIQVTGGSEAPIASTDYSGLMSSIATDSGSVASGYRLSHAGTIDNVKVDGVYVQRNSADGWTYDAGTNVLLFHGNAVPQVNANIEVNYEYYRALAVTNLTLSIDANATYQVDDIIELHGIALYEDNSSGPLAINSNDMNITTSNASVIALVNGELKAMAPGNADINVMLDNGVQSSISLTIQDYPLVTANQVITGIHLARNETATYKFEAAQSGTLTFESNSSYDTYAYLYDANMTLITSNDDGGNDRNFRIVHALDAGTYYLRAKGYGGREIPSMDLNITFQ